MYKKQALNVYMTAFPEDSKKFATDFINRFFKNCCRYIIKDGKLVSMLFLLDGSLENGEESYPVAYLYAAATLPLYRGQGLMSELIEKAKKETAEKGKILITKPATESLYSYYERFGFERRIFKKEYSLSDIPINGDKLSAEEYMNLRKQFLRELPHIELEDREYSLKGLTFFGNSCFCTAVDMAEGKVKEYLTAEDPTDIETPFALLLSDKKTHLPERIYFGFAMD